MRRAALTLLLGGSAAAYTIDDKPGLGLRWEGVGAISGGGATTKLLMDYPEQHRSEVLDYLFKPNYGLNLQILKVELGGDTDATEGAEPSHMHYKGDEDYNRGYEWWLMKEAKARNPGIKLYGLPWGWPGWLDPAATADKQAKDAFADPNVTANYTLAWLLGAKRVHGLTIDYIGQWNERNAPGPYNSALRDMVAAHPELSGTTCLNRLPHYPGTNDNPDKDGCSKYEWNTTDGSRWVDEEGSIYDGRSARCLARCVNRNYISGCHTATFQWHLVSSFYDYLPWKRCGVVVANQPWSGNYEITSPTWALAHTSQFAPIGWRYAAHDSGVGMLKNGGSMVTRISPDMEDFSIVIEKMTSKHSSCARGSNPDSEPTEETLSITLSGAFLKAAQKKGLQVWFSDLSSGDGITQNPPDEQVFQKKDALSIGSDGTFQLKVMPEQMYTLTTLKTGAKGTQASPPKAVFPLPWKQTFDDETPSAPPKVWYDQMGAWEVQKSPYNDNRGNVMRQVVPVWPACWGYSCTGPTTYFGPEEGGFPSTNVTVAFDIRQEDHANFTFDMGGTSLVLDSAGTWSFGGQKGNVDFSVNKWHAISCTVAGGKSVSLSIDGKEVLGQQQVAESATCDDSTFPVDLSGWQYMGLKSGPKDADTAQKCQQACCDAGDSCHIWQFSEHPSRAPDCWIGSGTDREADPAKRYQSRGRGMAPPPPPSPVTPTPAPAPGLPKGWRLKLQMNRYIFAAIDNFSVTAA